MAASRPSEATTDTTASDEWSRWWLTGRFDAATPARTQQRRDLEAVRDRLLDLLRLRPGDDGLDVGCGDGTIGFGLLDRLDSGTVTFSDISADLVAHCQRTAAERGLAARCRFQPADAVTLESIGDRSVDVVTSRSVLCFVSDPAAAFGSFHRVLRPGGRLAVFEALTGPAPRTVPPANLLGYDASAAPELVARVKQVLRASDPKRRASLPDELDLLTWAHAAGLADIEVEVRLRFDTRPRQGISDWPAFLNFRSRPWSLSVGEAMAQALDTSDAARLCAILRPQVEAGEVQRRVEAWAFLSASKPT